MHKITWEAITVGELIGSGTAGDVYRGQYGGAPAAIKVSCNTYIRNARILHLAILPQIGSKLW